jgi:hypothetical protein
MQFMPGQECNVDYYEEMFGRYNATFPVGLYVDVMDESGKYNRWLCVNTANYNQSQFPTYELLRCDYIYQWVYKGRKYECPGVSQSQNSYNSGIWTDFRITTPEDQAKAALPLNAITETIFYDTRMLIDSNLYNEDSEPRAFLISKLNRINPKGILIMTAAQKKFDPHSDYIEKDEDGNIIGLWADYFKSEIPPIEIVPEEEQPFVPSNPITATLSSSGKPQVKIGGSTKTLTVEFFRNGVPMEMLSIDGWTVTIDNKPISDELWEIKAVTTSDNKYRFKFLGDDLYIGKVLTVQVISGEVTASVDLEILAL